MPKIKIPKFIILSGPSGVGKTVISKALEKKISGLELVVATTSRLPRKNEIDGKDYFFISDEEFRKRISDGKFIEWAKIGNYLYGVEMKNLKSSLSLLNIDYQGMKQVKEKYPESLAIFIKPPSIAALKDRLLKRAKETGMSDEEIEKRLASAERESEIEKFYDYCVINHENRIEEAVDQIAKIIKESKRKL